MTRLALPSKRVIRRILPQGAAEIRLRPEVLGRSKNIQCVVTALRTLQRIVSFVANVGEAGTVDTGRKGEYRDLTGGKVLCEMVGFPQTEMPVIGNGTRSRARP